MSFRISKTLSSASIRRNWKRVGLGLSSNIIAIAVCMSAIAADNTVDFNRDIRPILSDNCFYCHGQDAAHREADLRLDSAEGAMAVIDGKRAVVPGKPEVSELVRRVLSTDEDTVMPPPKTNRKLSEKQKELLQRWIAEGGKYDKHWAFIAPKKPELPAGVNAIDELVARRLRQEGLQASPPATPTTWLRRVSLDLTGLPPTPAQVAAFTAAVNSYGEKAYDAEVDRLLAQPSFGERMAVDWLDASRYADTHGFNNDSARSMWRWRDWVIDAFNSNMPYDRFITEQLAGDLLPNATLDQRIATGFCRNHVINSEGGIIDEEYRIEYVADRVRTMSTAWLGVTMECVRCHDHKFDPLRQRDYYGLFAFFNNVPEHGEDGRIANAVPLIAAPTKTEQAELDRLAGRVAELDNSLQGLRNSFQAADFSSIAAMKWEPIAKEAKLAITCDDVAAVEKKLSFPQGAPELTDDAVKGKAWRNATDHPFAEIAGAAVAFNKTLTVALWLKPDASNSRDVGLVSGAAYNGKREQQGFGKGHEIRLIDGEIEVRSNDYFPAYAMRVHSQGAAIEPGQWRHVTVISGGSKKASDVRIFVDGTEVRTIVTHDGVAGDSFGGAPPLAIGADRTPGAPTYRGCIDELTFFESALSSEEIRTQFRSQAVPFALKTADSAAASGARSWLRDLVLEAENAQFKTLLQERRETWEQSLAKWRSAPTAMVMQELAEPRPTYVLKRGAYDAPGDAVTAAVPESIIAPWPKDAPRNRLGLAAWLVDPAHPLTSRVVVNRLWAQLFGTGLVKTLEDFGSQGEYPSHPELLDYLAVQFRESGWNTKALIKQIVLSGTYRQSSRVSPELIARDPENRLLARGSRFRLPAETLRDQALAISGLLRERVGGPSVYPYQPDELYNGLVVGADYPGTKWTTSQGDDLFRRSLYTFWKRTVPHPVMQTFDVPDRETCTVRRSRTNTPLQALILMNEPAFVEAAQKLCARMEAEGGSSDEQRIEYGFEIVTARKPTAQEAVVLNKVLQTAKQQNAATAFQSLASVLLNLDETVTRE